MEKLIGGLADGQLEKKYDKEQLEHGIRIEQEHTKDPKIAKEIAMDHLEEDPLYYDKIMRMKNESVMDKVLKNAGLRSLNEDYQYPDTDFYYDEYGEDHVFTEDNVEMDDVDNNPFIPRMATEQMRETLNTMRTSMPSNAFTNMLLDGMESILQAFEMASKDE